MTFVWLDEAKLELSEAALYYHWQEPGLGESFVDQVEAAVQRIMGNPSLPREFDPPYRKVATERFPYQVIYVIEGESVFIVAVCINTASRDIGGIGLIAEVALIH